MSSYLSSVSGDGQFGFVTSPSSLNAERMLTFISCEVSLGAGNARMAT